MKKHLATALLLTVGSTLFLSGCSTDKSTENLVAQGKRPNFLLITTDDMGYTDLGAFGGQDIPTPNLDSLALQGVRLANFHTSVSCAPTRSMLMSGTGNHEAGMGSQQGRPEFEGQPGYERYISNRVATLPERLSAAGYHTYMAGKWHLGGTPGSNTPGDRGFERSFALIPGGGDHFKLFPGAEPALTGVSLRVPYTEDGQLVDELPDGFYSTTTYVDKMISYLKSNEADDQPFFAWVAPTAPHWPLQVHPDWLDEFVGEYDAGYDALCRARQQGALEVGVLPDGVDLSNCPETVESWEELSEEDRKLNRRVMELYAAMVAHLDSELGRLINYLDESGQLDNTYIIYHNDNGPDDGAIFDHRSVLERFNNELENLGNRDSWSSSGPGWADALSAPYKEAKGSQFEGGTRTAAFIREPNSSQTGRISQSLLAVMDVAPTILELADVEESAMNSTNNNLLPIRGSSFAALLDNTSQRIHDADEPIALDHAGISVLMQGDWKIVREATATNWHLFNTAEDPSETHDLASEQPQILAELTGKYEAHALATGILRRQPE